MQTITQPGPTVLQLTAGHPDGLPHLAVVAKRTYTLRPDGRCELAAEQLPLFPDLVTDPDNPGVVEHDADLFPYKPLTDVVVKGHATTSPARPRFDVTVEVGTAKKVVAVIGDRMAALTGSGEIVFTPPTPVERVPLRYDKAYGGTDQAALEADGDPYPELRPFLPPEVPFAAAAFFTYPRNPAGVGYLHKATVAAVNRLVLPNLEDPTDLLTPQRIVVGRQGQWPRMPIPHSVGWIEPASFPRAAYLGFTPLIDPLDGPLLEEKRGWASPNLFDDRPMVQKFDFRIANGASLGLQLPYLKGTEEVRLTHIHPDHRQFVVRLPGERPKIWVDGRKGTLKETDPVLHTVEIDVDRKRVSMVWCGTAVALRQYMDAELQKMPLKVVWPTG